MLTGPRIFWNITEHISSCWIGDKKYIDKLKKWFILCKRQGLYFNADADANADAEISKWPKNTAESTEWWKPSFAKEIVENADLHKPVLNKIMTTKE